MEIIEQCFYMSEFSAVEIGFENNLPLIWEKKDYVILEQTIFPSKHKKHYVVGDVILIYTHSFSWYYKLLPHQLKLKYDYDGTSLIQSFLKEVIPEASQVKHGYLIDAISLQLKITSLSFVIFIDEKKFITTEYRIWLRENELSDRFVWLRSGLGATKGLEALETYQDIMTLPLLPLGGVAKNMVKKATVKLARIALKTTIYQQKKKFFKQVRKFLANKSIEISKSFLKAFIIELAKGVYRNKRVLQELKTDNNQEQFNTLWEKTILDAIEKGIDAAIVESVTQFEKNHLKKIFKLDPSFKDKFIERMKHHFSTVLVKLMLVDQVKLFGQVINEMVFDDLEPANDRVREQVDHDRNRVKEQVFIDKWFKKLKQRMEKIVLEAAGEAVKSYGSILPPEN